MSHLTPTRKMLRAQLVQTNSTAARATPQSPADALRGSNEGMIPTQNAERTAPRIAAVAMFPADAVFDRRLSTTQKVVMAAIASYEPDPDGWRSPTHRELSAGLALAKSTVAAAIKALVDFGYVRKRPRIDARHARVGTDYALQQPLDHSEVR